MLTTTLDGLWVLQVLSGIEILAPELQLRPHLPRIESADTALSHPIAAELIDAGVITASRKIDDAVLEWLTVLSRRDIALLLHIRDAGVDPAPVHALLARFDHWWVTLERSADLIRISGVGTATTEQSAGLAVMREIDRLCGTMPASLMRPVTIKTGDLIDEVRGGANLRNYLRAKRFDPEQVRLLSLAAEPERSRQTSIVVVQSGAGPRVVAGPLTIIDTPEGRLLSEHASRDGAEWMVVTPGSADALAAALHTLLRRLPAEHSWYSHRKAV